MPSLGLLRATLLALFGLTGFGGPALAQTQAAPEAASGFTPKPLVRAEKHIVVAAHPLAAEAGRRILRLGGSATDAAIATQLALNVVEPQSSGLGGGGFALTWDAAAQQLDAWDGRETAPAAATPELFLKPDGAPLPFILAATSGLAVGTPGLARLLEDLHAQGGELSWAVLFEDAIRLAEDGFPVSPRLHGSLAFMARRLTLDPTIAALFYDAQGAPLPVGATLRQPALARTLRTLAAGGAQRFYEGPIADAVAASVQAKPRPGSLAPADLADYRAVRRLPACALFRERFEICGMPPPSSGGVTVLQILGLLERAPQPRGPAQEAHLFLEASRLAYADRDRYLADPDHVPQPVEGLLAEDYLSARATLIDPDQAGAGLAEPGTPQSRDPLPRVSSPGRGLPGTTHLTVVDAAGNVVSMTTSIEVAFGAGRMAAGLFLNNQLTDFSFFPEVDGSPVANAVASGKRPRSSMAPVIVFDRERGGRPVLALGSPGGSRIIEYVAGALKGLLDLGLDPAQAAARPHVSHRNRLLAIVEQRSDADALAGDLARFGHEVRRADLTSGLHIVRITEDGALEGGADPRREGAARGD